MTNVEIMHDFLQRVWVDADMDLIDRVFAPNVGAEGLLPDMTLTPEDFKTMVLALLNLVEHPEITVIKTLSDENWVSVMIRVRAESQINTAVITATGQIIARFEHGLIVEVYNHFDFLGLFQQLGLIPHEAVMLCLSGEPLV
ncbi:ester cyclase [Oceaniglobus ichthyenteri]|uniref:ester cyclase n=1 Tax=Oceaniglobus ichthyenteri TaxID=2136177 RepID=UPI000D38BD87|nr:ester cyclase [Oceaniglobus ichthyenteri]